jgi:lipoprotein-releasing system permease protein
MYLLLLLRSKSIILKFEVFIAKRIIAERRVGFSRPVVRLGIASVALGLSVMIIAIAIVTGFQQEVRDKVIGFGSHIQITGFEVTTSFEAAPVSIRQPFYPDLKNIPGIRHIQIFANKAGIIKTEDQIEGVVLKGIGSDFDCSFFEHKIIAGGFINVSDTARTDEVVISLSLARRLKLNVGDAVRMYFIIPDELQPRGRRFIVAGIYETGLEEFDRMYVIGDIWHIQRLNKWTSDQVGGFEVLVEDFRQIEKLGEMVNQSVGYELKSQTIKQLQPQIFEWLALHDMNVIIIIVLMVLVAGITMISTLLILILERTAMIGVLKALGAKSSSIRKVFLLNAVYIIGKGLLIGNLIAFSLSWLQLRTGWAGLDQESYYVSQVPVNLQLSHYFLTNIGTLMVCTLMLIIPTYIVTRISPVKAIRFT